ncbi:MAG: hypothetical protein IJT98_08185 [Prevotella sp.]|nr:hypothetical protein [Prevotella sp.]
MKKIFTLITAALMALGVSAQSWYPTADTSVEANQTYVDDDALTVKSTFAGTLKEASADIDGVSFTHYIQVRAKADPSADAPEGTDNGGSTTLVITAKQDAQLKVYYRRQSTAQTDNVGTYASNDGKDMKMKDQSDYSIVDGTLTIHSETSDGKYGFATKVYQLEAGHSYVIWGRGTTINFYGLEYTVASNSADATFDFENNPENWPVGEGVDFAAGNLTSPLAVNGITLTNVQGNASQPARIMRANDGISALYVYKNGSIKFNAPEGKALTKIAVTMKTGSFDLTANNGTIAENTWTGNATEVIFTSSATRQMLKIEVFLADENDETVKPAAESFDVEAADIAAFRAVEDGKVVKLTLNNAQVNALDDIFNLAYVEDATGAIEVSGITLTAGQLLNGYIIGTKSSSALDFANPEFGDEIKLIATDGDTFTATEGTLVATNVEVTTIATAEYHGRLLTIKNVEIQKEGRFYYAYSGEDKVQVKDAFMVLPADYEWPEKAKSITGLCTFNGARFQIAPLKEEDIVAESANETTVLFDWANNNLNLPVGTADDTNAGNLGGKTVTADGVTLKFVNAMTMPTRYYLNGSRGNQLQFIAGGQMRVTAPEGYAVTAIISTGNPATNASTGAITYQTSWEVVKGGGSLTAANQQTQTWTGNAESVLLNSKAATYLDAITVTLAPVNDETALLANEEADSYVEVSGLTDFANAANNALVKLTLTDAIITSTMINGWGYYVQDANAGANFYCTGLDFEVGDVLNGVVYVKKNNQNMGARICMTEATSAEELSITKNGTYAPIEGTIADINVAANKCRVVKLTDVAVKGTSETAATVTDVDGVTIALNNGKTNYFPYVIQESLASIDYTKATIVGILYGSSATVNQIMPLSITENITDGISTADAAATDAVVIYNLQGVRQQQLVKGINIVNGRKVVVK